MNWRKVPSLHSLRIVNGISKNYTVDTKIKNNLLIWYEIEKILTKYQNSSLRNGDTTLQFPTNSRIMNGVWVNNLKVTQLFVDFSNVFISMHRRNMEQILLVYGLSKEIAIALIILFIGTDAMTHSPKRDIDFSLESCKEIHEHHIFYTQPWKCNNQRYFHIYISNKKKMVSYR